MNKLLENDRILLRAVEPEDLDTLYAWENDTELWKYGSTTAPISRFALMEYIMHEQQNIYENGQLRMMIVRKDDLQLIGAVDLYDFDAFHQKAGVSILIDRAYQQGGFATSALALLEKYAFDFLKLHQLYAFVSKSNTSSLKLFEKAGFIHSAVLKDWISWQHSFEDAIIMQKINSSDIQ
ncbi:GNAT family N-acetyltransferase [Dysgonamonadaceae bacterium]|jgi:diamine N-acetyltransferase|nr:GNAT family N-acetyltransferase [Dysgonamonadaceae bacterium]